MAQTRYQTKVVAGFGGGLNFIGHPIALRDDEWTDSDGWLARLGYAETLRRFVNVFPNYSLGTGLRPIGIVQWPHASATGVLIGFVDDSTAGSAGTSNVRLFTVRDDGTSTEITFAGTDTAGGTVRLTGDPDAVMQLSFLNGRFFVNCGNAGGSNYSVARIATAPGATYQTLVPPGVADLRPAFLSSFAGHLIASFLGQTAPTWRQIRASDQGLETVWDPDIDNSADDFQLDTPVSGIIGQVTLTPNQLALITRDAIYTLQPTGSFPPFTLQLASRPGGLDQRPTFTNGVARNVQLCGIGPYGMLYRGVTNVYLLGRGPVGTVLADYIRTNDFSQGVAGVDLTRVVTPIAWDELRSVYWLGSSRRPGAAIEEMLAYDPTGAGEMGTWSRRTVPLGVIWRRQAFIWDDSVSTPNSRRYGRMWLAGRGRELYVEDALTETAPDNNYIDTKDFTFGDSPRRIEVTRVKVDWEGLGSGSDSLIVSVWNRDDFPVRNAAGSLSGLPPSGAFTQLAQLVGGQSEIPTRFYGKFLRFRLVAVGSRCRIRGFSFRWRYVDDRITP